MTKQKDPIKIAFFADESGQLHKNSNKRYFVIGGFFCKEENLKLINRRYKRVLWKIKKKRKLPKKDELKGRQMTQNEKIKLINILQNSDGFNGFALVVDKDKMIRKVEKENIYFNYFINQIMVSTLFVKLRKVFNRDEEILINMILDNRNVSVGHLKGLEDYLNSEYLFSNYNFKTTYGDSAFDYRIQASDLIANTIYEAFKEPDVVSEVLKIIDFDKIVVISFPDFKRHKFNN